MCKDFISKILHRASKQDLECDDIYNHVADVRARSSKCPRICFPVILVELKSIQLHVCNLSPLPPQHRIPKQGIFGWSPARQLRRQAAISAPGRRNRAPENAACARQLCTGGNQTSPTAGMPEPLARHLGHRVCGAIARPRRGALRALGPPRRSHYDDDGDARAPRSGAGGRGRSVTR